MLLSLDAQPDKRGQISPAAIERTVNKQCELSNTRRYARALRTRLTPAPSVLKSSREPRTENGERSTEHRGERVVGFALLLFTRK